MRIVNGNRVVGTLHFLELFHNAADEFPVGRRNPFPKLSQFPLCIQVTVLLVVNDDTTVAVERLIPQTPDLDGLGSKASSQSRLVGYKRSPDFPIDADVVWLNDINGF